MVQNLTISIIIPTYNRAHIIKETLDSVLKQEYIHWECIVVDDGSTDHTEKIVKEYIRKDVRFQYYKRPDSLKKGANACRNFGYEKSKGSFVQWFDSDDIMHPEKLKIKLDFAQKNDADIVIDTHQSTHEKVTIEPSKIEVFTSKNFYIDYILGKKPVITNDVMVRCSKIGDLRFDENLHKAQEYEFFSRLFEQKLTYCFIDVALTFYRDTADSISKKTSKGNKAQVESLIYLSDLIQNRHHSNELLVERARRLGRKVYRSQVKRKSLSTIIKYFGFFRKVYRKNPFIFFLYVCYNMITGRGLDRMNYKTNSIHGDKI